MGQDDTGDLVSVLYQSIHNMHLLKFLQQFCSGAWDTANGKHIRGFELNTITTSNYELNKFHGIRRGMPSRWLGSWPPKVNAVFRKLLCQFMLGDVWVCSVGSWIHPEMNHFFFFPFYWDCFSALSPDRQPKPAWPGRRWAGLQQLL